MISRFDHTVIAVRDLEAAISTYRALGFEVSPGGHHTGLGTALPHQESDFAFSTQYTSCGSSLRFQLSRHFINSPSPKRQEAAIMRLKGQIPGESV